VAPCPATPEEAEGVQFRGSPSLVVDGRDAFGEGKERAGLQCRRYDSDADVPTVKAIIEALQRHAHGDDEL
jgi:hypothetical protein